MCRSRLAIVFRQGQARVGRGTVVQKTTRAWHWAIHRIRHQLTRDLAQMLFRIDYCNAVLYGVPSGTLQKLQWVQNNAARIIFQAPKRLHAKPVKPLYIGAIQYTFAASKTVTTIAIRLRYDYDTTMPRRIRLRRK